MGKNLYGTIPSIAWVFSHYFYGHTHYMFFAGEYYPYRLNNPRSSNPYLIYQELYEPWKDADDFSKIVNGYRLALWRGVEIKRKEGAIDDALAMRLKEICDKVNIAFFYPVVCRVASERIAPARLKIAGSGLRGSSEFLVEDLDEDEIDELLFLDFHDDTDFESIVVSEYGEYRRTKRYTTTQEEVLLTLERRCDSLGVRKPVSAT